MTTFILIFLAILGFWFLLKNQTEPKKHAVKPEPNPIYDPAPAPQEVVFRLHIETSYRAPEITPEPDKDAWEVWDKEQYGYGSPEHKLEGVRLHISFVDREGKATQRDVDVKRYSHDPKTGAGMIYAFCHLRQANRPFVFSRIKQTSDPETGEVIPNIGQYLDGIYQGTPLYAVEQFLSEHDAAIFTLFSLAKADGALRAKERAIIVQWASLHGLEQAPDLLTLEEQIKGWHFTKHSFYEAVKTVTKQVRTEQYMQELWAAMQAIVASDKKQHPDEDQLLSYAARQWSITQTSKN